MNKLDFIIKPPNFYEWLKARGNRGGSPSPVPSDYDLLEYLESDGTAFIKLPWRVDVGATAAAIRNLNDGYEIKFLVSDNQQAPFGSRDSYFIKSEDGYFWTRAINDSSSNVLNSNVAFTTDLQTWKYENGKLYANDNLIHDFWDPVYISSGFGTPLYLFGRYTGNNSSSGNNGHIRIYYMKHTNSIRDDVYPNIPFELYPVRRKADSVLGMYDVINDTFYTNSGGGFFIAPT